MLASFVITLCPEADVSLPGLGGEALHGLWFEALRRADADFAAQLHDLRGPRPFSLSGVLNAFPRRQGRLAVPAGNSLTFRLGLLDDEVIDCTLTAFLHPEKIGGSLRLGSTPVRLGSVAFQTGSHRLVRSATYPALLQNATDAPRLTLRFLSPTSFRSGTDQDVLPRPERVFGSLFQAWQAWSPVRLDDHLPQVFSLLRIAAYELRTELVHFGRYKVIGFKGQVTYAFPPELRPDVRRLLHALADFAFYAGVGYKTTMGLGQAGTRQEKNVR